MPHATLRTLGRIHIAAVFVLAVSVAILGLFAIQSRSAICSFKRDLQGRAQNTAAFIEALETGQRPPIPGITVADLQRSLAGQRATLRALEGGFPPMRC